MKNLVVLALLVTVTNASAYEYRERSSLKSHEISARQVAALKVTFSKKLTISGACNSARVFGELRNVEIEPGFWEFFQTILVDLSAGQTEMGCDGEKEVIVSKSFTFPANAEGDVGLNLLAPSTFDLSIEEVH